MCSECHSDKEIEDILKREKAKKSINEIPIEKARAIGNAFIKKYDGIWRYLAEK